MWLVLHVRKIDYARTVAKNTTLKMRNAKPPENAYIALAHIAVIQKCALNMLGRRKSNIR